MPHFSHSIKDTSTNTIGAARGPTVVPRIVDARLSWVWARKIRDSTARLAQRDADAGAFLRRRTADEWVLDADLGAGTAPVARAA